MSVIRTAVERSRAVLAGRCARNTQGRTRLLVGTVVVTYLVMLLGVLLANTEVHSAVAAIHHGLAFVGGILVLTCFCVTLADRDRSRWVLIPIGGALALYPLQGLLGWLLSQGAAQYGTAHVLVGMGVFGLVLYGLIQRLDRSHPAAERPSMTQAPEITESPATARPQGLVGRSVAGGRAYLALTKPRLMWLLSLLAVAGIGLAAAAGAAVDGVTVVATVGGGVLAVGASGTFNHVYERDRDRLMARTADRPVATAAVPAGRAAGFGGLLAAAGIGTMWAFTTPLAAVLTAAAIAYYAVVYTVLLKPNTTWNIAIGGGSGALPAIIGWAAVTGSIGAPAVLLALVVVIWTPAHFYNLAILHYRDYERGGYPMLPIEKSVRVTRRRIGYSIGATLIATTALGHVADLRAAFVLAAIVGGVAFLGTFVTQYERRSSRLTRRTFVASNAFLGVVLAAIILETLLL